MASLDDIATIQKNGVIGINALTRALEAFREVYSNFVGSSTFLGAAENSLVKVGSGRLVNLTVSVAGSAGTAHDAASVADASTSNVIAVIPATAGTHQINVPFTNGLVLKPGASQTVSVTYS